MHIPVADDYNVFSAPYVWQLNFDPKQKLHNTILVVVSTSQCIYIWPKAIQPAEPHGSIIIDGLNSRLVRRASNIFVHRSAAVHTC